MFPAGDLEARAYLQRLGIVADEVIDSDLSRFGVSATPTIIVADGERKVSKAWVGALGRDSRAAVLSSLTCTRCGS